MTIRAGARLLSDRFMATVALMVAAGMQAGDATIVNVALTRVEDELGGGVALGAWVMTSYLCANAVFAPLTGWLRRRCGVRALFAASVALFVIASLACALSPSAAVLIASRIVQGAAGGIIHPMTQAMLLDLYPKERHGKMLGLWGAATMVGPIMGPLLGGVITDLTSWRWAFAINLPLGALALFGTWRVLPRGERTETVPIDMLGIVLLIAGIAALQLWLQRGVGHSWLQSPELIVEAGIAVAAVLGIALHTRNRSMTILRLDMLRDVNFAAAAFYNFMTSALLFTALVFIPALMEGPLGYPATIAGATIVPRAVLMMLMMLWMGRLISRVDCRVLLSAGWVLMAIGLLLLANIRPDRDLVWIVAASTIQAIGAGMLFTPLSTLAFSTLAPERRTDAAGLYSLLRQLGCACGVALMTAVLRGRVDAETLGTAVETIPAGAAGLRAYEHCFAIMGIVAVAVTPGVLLFRGEGLRSPVPHADIVE